MLRIMLKRSGKISQQDHGVQKERFVDARHLKTASNAKYCSATRKIPDTLIADVKINRMLLSSKYFNLSKICSMPTTSIKK